MTKSRFFHMVGQNQFPEIIHLLLCLTDLRLKSRLAKSIIWFPTKRSFQMLSVTMRGQELGGLMKPSGQVSEMKRITATLSVEI